MKKNLLFVFVCVLGLFGSLNAQKTVTLGDGETTYSSTLPFNNSYNYSASQQLYSLNELNIPEPGTAVVDTIAFKSASENLNESYIQVYMKNVNTSSYAKADEWVPVTENDKVFEGYYSTTGLDEWCKIALTTPFTYSGNNVLVCVNVCYKYELSTDKQDQFYTYSKDTEKAYSCTIRSSEERVDVTNVTAEMLEHAYLSPEKNQIKFIYSQSENEIDVNYKSIDLGNIALGNNWNEKEDASVVVTIAAAYDKVKSVTCSDSFFALSEIDYAKVPVQFVVTCNKEEATAGKKEAVITINSENGKVIEVPVTANVYEAVSPDVFELAKEITFTDGVFTDKPDFATLHDDYLLPNERLDNYAPDAVYSLTIESDTMVLVNVDGPNAKIALYTEDFSGEKGPKADNVYAGEEKILSTTFSYDFEDGKLDDFTVEDYDEFKDYTWKIEDGSLISLNFDSWGEYGTDSWGVMNEANERIITKNTYAITPNSVFTLDVNRVENNAFLNLYVEVTKDGEEFIEMEWLNIPPNYYDENPEVHGEYQVTRRVDLGAKFASLGLEYGDYQIAIHNLSGGSGAILVDNLTLTERDKVVGAGKYYLVVAAEDEFEVTVTYAEIPEDDENPTDTIVPTPVTVAAPDSLTAEALSTSSIKLTWSAVENATSYNVYVGDSLAKNTTDTTYTVEGLAYDTEYCFTVTAVNNTLESEKSDQECVKTLGEGVEELSSSFEIYPNPVKNELFLATEFEVESISVYDIYGRQQAVSYQPSAVSSIDVANLDAGVYFVNIKTENGNVVKRFVKN